MGLAVKSSDRTNVFINKNFVIRVYENGSKKSVLTTARKLSNYVLNEELKIRLFYDVLCGNKQKYTFKIRKRLKIDFVSK